MGCCFSTYKPPPSPEFHRHSSKSSRAPPSVDEETVKEVLSETHNRNNHFLKIEHGPTNITTTPQNSLHKIQHQHNNDNLEDISLSEICSAMSENISTTTFEEENEIIRRRVTDRSPAKLRNSPVRSKQQSPGRVRSEFEINNRGSGFGSTGRQRPVSRSRSPANRTAVRGGGTVNGMGRRALERKRENSPGRFGSGLPERIQKPDLSSGMVSRIDDESFENPLVSLECFIFL